MNTLHRLAQTRFQQESLSSALTDAQKYEKELLQQHANEERLFANGFAFRYCGRDVLIKGATCDYATEAKEALVITYKMVTPTGEYVDTILEQVLAQEAAHIIQPNAESTLMDLTDSPRLNERALVVEAA